MSYILCLIVRQCQVPFSGSQLFPLGLFLQQTLCYSPCMPSVLIKNIGALVTGDLKKPLRNADSIYVEDGIVRVIGNGLNHRAEIVIDAHGITAIPGLIDSHSHPTFGDFTPAQNSLSWITHYMHGGVTALVSAGELHLPGLPLPPDAKTAMSLALLAKRCWDNLRPSGVKVHGGTLLLVPGLKEKDFDEIAAAGIRLVKFIFYDYSLLPNGEAERYVKWARERGVERIVGETDYYVEICSSGNSRMVLSLMCAVKIKGAFHRLLIGTDTPGGTGIIPRGMLREIAFLSSVAEVTPEVAVCMATGNVGCAHALPLGTLEEGKAADILLLDRIQGSVAQSALDAFAKGDLPGISVVIIDGEIRVWGRSQQTPPPERAAVIEKA